MGGAVSKFGTTDSVSRHAASSRQLSWPSRPNQLIPNRAGSADGHARTDAGSMAESIL